MDQLIEQADAPKEVHMFEQEVNNHMDQEEPVGDLNQMEVDGEDDLDLNLLVGPGEEGFPVFPNGGMQLPHNQVEMDIMALADEQLQEQILAQQHIFQQPALQLQQVLPGQAPVGQAPQNNQPEQEFPDQVDNHHLQVGFALMSELHFDPVLMKQGQGFKGTKNTPMAWQPTNNQGINGGLLVHIPNTWIPFFNILLSSTDKFDWARDFLKSGASTFLDDGSGMSPVSIPDHCDSKHASHFRCADLPFSSLGGKGNEKEELGKDKIVQEGAMEAEKGGCRKKKSGSKRITPLVDTQVRRSERVRLGSVGFKYSGCTSQKCSSCYPPS